MKTNLVAGCLILGLCIYGCGPRQPRARHVILLGFDAMSARDIQRAETPGFNHLIENGAVSLHTRCVRDTAGSQNWMSLVSGAPVEMHGVSSDGCQSIAPANVPPALSNAEGKFPTVFDQIRAQRPFLKQYAFIAWTEEARLYDMGAFDLSYVYGIDSTLREPLDLMKKAFDTYLQDRPEVLFLSMGLSDPQCDALIDDFVQTLEARDWMKNTVILVTAGHGGDPADGFEIPVILYGKGVTKGKVMKRTNLIYDVGATVAGLVGVKLPWECRGRFLSEAFQPADLAR
jgi:hypothetical protein